jgi:hypothetical protein
MRNLIAFISLFFALFAFVPLRADNATATKPTNPSTDNTQPILTGSDPYEGIVMYQHADDFSTLQQLAVQNRSDRIVLMQQSLACFQQASTIDDIYRCRIDEGKALNRIRLTYCETGVATPKRVGGKKTIDGDDQAKATSCQKSIAALAGKRLKKGKHSPTTINGPQAPGAGDGDGDGDIDPAAPPAP